MKGLQQAKMESEHKRKKLEGQLQEFMARVTEGERAKGELSERTHKLQVNMSNTSSKKLYLHSFFVIFFKQMLCCYDI